MIEERESIIEIAGIGTAEAERSHVQLIDDEILEAGWHRSSWVELVPPELRV